MRSTRYIVLVVSLASPLAAALAQPARPARPVTIDGTAALKARARVSGDSAIAIARRAVPNGVIQSAELETEGGTLIYSFDMTTAGRSGIDEIHVDAMTGKIVGREHETPADERKEAAKEAKGAKKP